MENPPREPLGTTGTPASATRGLCTCRDRGDEHHAVSRGTVQRKHSLVPVPNGQGGAVSVGTGPRRCPAKHSAERPFRKAGWHKSRGWRPGNPSPRCRKRKEVPPCLWPEQKQAEELLGSAWSGSSSSSLWPLPSSSRRGREQQSRFGVNDGQEEDPPDSTAKLPSAQRGLTDLGPMREDGSQSFGCPCFFFLHWGHE